MQEFLQLRRKLESFEIDSRDSTFSFSDRLARDNDWTHEYTRRVIVEYKRFTYLAVAAGHPVSPSEHIDQAWHLHLCYTENYWRIFCPEILGRPLHHMPSQGGKAEREKFANWYEQTLESYLKHFGQQPPVDIWPSPETKRGLRQRFTRVDRARNWVIPKPKLASVAKACLVLALVPLTILCTGAAPGKDPNIFNWSGVDFLLLYLSIFTVGTMIAVLLRYHLREPHAMRPLVVPSLDPYSIAYLNGGKGLTVDAALANLIRQKAVHLDSPKRILTRTGTAPEFSHEIEHRIYSAIDVKGSEVKNIRLAAKSTVEKIIEHLQSLGLTMSRAVKLKAILVPYGLIVAIIAIGTVKIFIGSGLGKPIGFLVLACFIAAIGIVIGLTRSTIRSRYGDAVLGELQDKHPGKAKLGRKTATIPAAEFVMILGLFGMSALAHTDLDHLRRSLATSGSDGGSVDGSSCGGGDGGGGGCGGCGGD